MTKLISALVSAAILAVLYWRVDGAELAGALARTDPAWFAGSMVLIAVILHICAVRLRMLAPADARSRLTLGEANRLIYASASLNMVLPSKLGDLAKGIFLQRDGHCSGALALAIVVFEKAVDMLALLVVGLVALLVLDGKGSGLWTATAGVAATLAVGTVLLVNLSAMRLVLRLAGRLGGDKVNTHAERLEAAWLEMHSHFWEGGAWVGPWAVSVFLWGLHLVQIWMLGAALGLFVEPGAFAALVPLAILAGLLPLTFAGIGTRDVALVVLLAPHADAAQLAALGALTITRYAVPALAGLLFLPRYLSLVRR